MKDIEGERIRLPFTVMNKARAHASSCTLILEPMDAVFLSILAEQEKEISSLQEAVKS
jgi:hypothetical protein